MKKVLITGAGRGIGLALTKAFLANGFSVHATYRDAKKASDLFQLQSKQSGLTLSVVDVVDASTYSSIESALGPTHRFDFLINNSGVVGGRGRHLKELAISDVQSVLSVNLIGAIQFTQFLVPRLTDHAVIAQISSRMGSITDNSSGGYYDYRISKAALNMFSSCLANEFPNFTCLTLHPGWVQTAMGGPGATVTPADSANGLFRVITTSPLTASGKFFDYQGKSLPW